LLINKKGLGKEKIYFLLVSIAGNKNLQEKKPIVVPKRFSRMSSMSATPFLKANCRTSTDKLRIKDIKKTFLKDLIPASQKENKGVGEIRLCFQ
jgi:hypothetical protein